MTILERFDLFKETFNVFGTFILKKSDDEIEYLVFEEFITYVTCYLHENTLIDLLKNKLIDQYVFDKSILLREEVLNIDGGPLWTLDEIKENEYNLNIPRYVDTFEEEDPIDLQQVQSNIARLKIEIAEAEKQMDTYLKELGL